MKLIERTIEQKFYYDKGMCMIEETTERYTYDSVEERYRHSEEMQNNGYEDNGRVLKNYGTITKPKYVDFGSYSKSIRVDLTR